MAKFTGKGCQKSKHIKSKHRNHVHTLPGPRERRHLRSTWTSTPWPLGTSISPGREGGAASWTQTRCRRGWRSQRKSPEQLELLLKMPRGLLLPKRKENIAKAQLRNTLIPITYAIKMLPILINVKGYQVLNMISEVEYFELLKI